MVVLKSTRRSWNDGCVDRHNTFQIDFSTPWMGAGRRMHHTFRQQRTVKLWMHFRAARAAREPYRRERGLLQQGPLVVRRVNAPRTNLSSLVFAPGPTFRCSRLGMRRTRLRSGHCLQRPRWRSRRGGRRRLPLPRSGCQGPVCGLATHTSPVYFEKQQIKFLMFSDHVPHQLQQLYE